MEMLLASMGMLHRTMNTAGKHCMVEQPHLPVFDMRGGSPDSHATRHLPTRRYRHHVMTRYQYDYQRHHDGISTLDWRVLSERKPASRQARGLGQPAFFRATMPPLPGLSHPHPHCSALLKKAHYGL